VESQDECSESNNYRFLGIKPQGFSNPLGLGSSWESEAAGEEEAHAAASLSNEPMPPDNADAMTAVTNGVG